MTGVSSSLVHGIEHKRPGLHRIAIFGAGAVSAYVGGRLAQAGVTAVFPPDIQVAMWEKFVLVAAFSGVGAVTRAPVGVLCSLPETRAIHRNRQSPEGPRGKGRLMHTRWTIEEHVRWSDTDCTEMMYYGQFLRLFDIADTDLFRAVGLPYAGVCDRLGIWLPRVQIHGDFRKPLVLDDLIEVSAYVGRFGSKSLTLQFEVTKKGETDLGARGHAVLACVNRSTFTSVAIPGELIDSLGPYLATS
jgi:YbgC/YbaW family acyl-CoA thioester hydrolase